MEVTSMLGAVQALIGIGIDFEHSKESTCGNCVFISTPYLLVFSILQRVRMYDREKKGGTCYLYKSTSTRRSSPNVFSLGIRDL